jgi:hypothetical protein
MKNLIHIDIRNEEGENECYEKHGGFFTALLALYAIWRYGEGRVQIGEEPEEKVVS